MCSWLRDWSVEVNQCVENDHPLPLPLPFAIFLGFHEGVNPLNGFSVLSPKISSHRTWAGHFGAVLFS